MKNHKILVVLISLLVLLIFTAAVKKPVPKKTPKPIVAILVKQLKAADESILVLQAQKVSLTAKVVALEGDIIKLKKSKANLITIGYITAGTLIIIAVIIFVVMSVKKFKSSTSDKKTGTPSSEEHFADIEYNVLDDWHNVWYHPEKINKELYEDLKNHFAELYAKIEKWKIDSSRRGVFTGHLISLLSTKYPDIEGTDSIYLLALSENEPFIEDNEIAVGRNICAHSKRNAEISAGQMKEYYKEVMSLYDTEFVEVKALTNELAELKDEIDIDIRKIKHFRKLTGECKFLKV